MPYLTTALTRSALKTHREKKQTIKRAKIKNFTAKTQYINLKAPSNNVKMQSDKTLTKTIYFFQTTQRM